jgi:hypothetical protein
MRLAFLSTQYFSIVPGSIEDTIEDTMGYYAYEKGRMGYYGILWGTMGYYGILWDTMDLIFLLYDFCTEMLSSPFLKQHAFSRRPSMKTSGSCQLSEADDPWTCSGEKKWIEMSGFCGSGSIKFCPDEVFKWKNVVKTMP